MPIRMGINHPDWWVYAFRYFPIQLAKTHVATLRATGLDGLIPLWMLTQDGATREVAKEVFQRTRHKPELLSVALTLATLIFPKKRDIEWLQKEVSVLEDLIDVDTNVFIQHFIRKTENKERQETLQLLRQIIIRQIHKRFPDLVGFVEEHTNLIYDINKLQEVLDDVIASKNAEEVKQIFNSSR